MITENLSTLKIHKLTQAQYDREFAVGNIDPNALYLTPDTANTIPYGICATAADVAEKVANTDNFSLSAGIRVTIKFTVTNTAANPTLNINSTGAKAIYYNGTTIAASYLKANKTYDFLYNGIQWELIGDIGTIEVVTSSSETTTHAANIIVSPEDIVAGETPLETGRLYFVYE